MRAYRGFKMESNYDGEVEIEEQNKSGEEAS